MVQVKADKSKNLLEINFSGRVDPDQTRQSTENVSAALGDLSEGFRLLTDLTGLESMDNGCAPHIRKAMQLCDQKAVARVVRIIPDPTKDIGFNILSIFNYRRGVPIITVKTREEAMKSLG